MRQRGRDAFTLCLPDGTRTPACWLCRAATTCKRALAAAAIGWQLGVPNASDCRCAGEIQGIGRWFNQLATLELKSGGEVALVDYGHHPKNWRRCFAAARGG